MTRVSRSSSSAIYRHKGLFDEQVFVSAFGREAGAAFSTFLNFTNDILTADQVFDVASRFVWRNRDEVEEAVNCWWWNVTPEHGKQRAMMAFILTAMMDGRGKGGSTWNLMESHFSQEIASMIREYRDTLIASDDVEAWSHLPDIMKIYRGTVYKGKQPVLQGCSFTLDPHVAEDFARCQTYGDQVGAVYEARVRKDDVLFYSNYRRESEIIIHGGMKKCKLTTMMDRETIAEKFPEKDVEDLDSMLASL
jgi:hypothetical protein